MFWLTGGTASPQWTVRLQGRKPELFFALVTVEGDTGQLMDREVSEPNPALTCKEQKVFATHELLGMLCLVIMGIYFETYESCRFILDVEEVINMFMITMDQMMI